MLKDSVILTFSKGIKGILMLIFNMVIARVFSESLFGTYKHIVLIVTMLTAICAFGIPTTISYYYSSYDKNKKNKLFGNTILILSIVSVITSIGILLFKNQLALLLNNPDIIVFANILAVYVLVMIISSFLENLYIASNNAVLLGKIYITYIICNFIMMIISVLVFKSLYLTVLGIALIELLRTVIMYFAIKKKENLLLKFDRPMINTQIRFAIPLGVVAIVQNINLYIDNLFISNNFAPDQYAAFANGAMDIPFVSIVTVSVATVILPKMSKVYKEDKDTKEILNIWGDSCTKIALIMYPIFWIAMLFSVGYIELLFSSKYVATSTPIFVIYLMKFPLYCTVFGNILIVLGRQKYIMYNSLIGVILNMIFNFTFLNIFGMKGPAMASVSVQYIVVFLQLRQISKSTGLSITKLMPYKRLFKIFLIPGLIAVPFYILSILFSIPQYIGLIVFGMIIYGLSFIIYYKLQYIDANLINGFISKVSRKNK